MGVNLAVALHYFKVDPKVKLVKQKLWQFDRKKDKVIRVEVQKLLEERHIREV